jgi:hypothetical protein
LDGRISAFINLRETLFKEKENSDFVRYIEGDVAQLLEEVNKAEDALKLPFLVRV